MPAIKSIMERAYEKHLVIPAFNMPYIPMIKPVVKALKDSDTFGLITVARLEWVKFSSGSLEVVAEEYHRCSDSRVTRLHLDHVPVIDEDHKLVDYLDDISRAIGAGYTSVMVDGSRLTLSENIAAVREVVALAHCNDVPVEAELGTVMGHESGPMPNYEELFATGKGFTNPDDAEQFVRETAVDWLSVAVGSVHGAIAPTTRSQKKIVARLHIGRLIEIDERLRIPLVLHGGSGIALPYLKDAFQHGIAKLNIGTDIRQPYEALISESEQKAQDAVYTKVRELVAALGIEGTASLLSTPAESVK